MAQSREIEKLQRRWQENPLGLTFAPLAEAYRKEGMFEEALELLELGLAQHPSYVPAHIVCARCHLDVGAEGKAEEAFQRVADLDPENVIARKGLAEIAERAGRFREAAGRLESLLELDRNNEDAKAQLERVRAMLATPSPGTIDLGAAPTAGVPERPEATRPSGASPAGDGAADKIRPIEVTLDPVDQPAPVELAEASPPWAARSDAEPSDAEPSDASEPAAVDEGAELAAVAEEGVSPELGGEWAADDEASDVELALRADGVEEPGTEGGADLYRPLELTAAPATEYQPPSDSESLQSERVEEVSESGEYVPLFAGQVEPTSAADEVSASGPAGDAPRELAAAVGTTSAEAGTDLADATASDSEAVEGEEPELVVTATMAEVFLRQGHRELALAVYAQLHQRAPDDARIRAAIEQLESELQPARVPSAPSHAAALTGGQSVRSLMEALLTAPVPGAGADDDLPIGSVFGDEEGSAAAPEAAEERGPTFDEFFASDAPPAPVPESPPVTPAEDIEDFNAWLRGLKR